MTSRITVLPGDVANRIAAGEVVERPASVVKELVENAIDAGSTRVSVDVEQAGRRLIRVTDDGGGMAPEEAALAFHRHATSKIRTEADLFTIRTMGFRGEALPSITAVSKVRLVTVAAGAAVGTEIRMEGGSLVKQRETAAAPGTTVEVADLFYNTPARKKFLKSPATEFGHICQAVQRQALAFPAIHFRLSHDGNAVSDYPAVRSLRERVQQVYGETLVDACVEVDEKDGALHLEGFACRPLEATGSRTPQDLFVNRRWVKNSTIAHALSEGYGTYLAKGRHPRFVLALAVDPRHVDVNVHPTKREVRFSDQERVHEWIRSRIQAVVGPASAPSRMTAVSGWTPPQGAAIHAASPLPAAGTLNPSPSLVETAAEPAQPYLPSVDLEVRPMGQIATRYLLAQIGDEVQIVDQHTAHERVLFERLTAQFDAGAIASQHALLPQMVELSAGEVVAVRAHLEDLRRLGFEVEEFGQGTVVVRAMPALVDQSDPQALLRSMVEDWEERASTPSVQERYNAVLATMACHSAVRAGRRLEQAEMRKLLEDWRDAGFPGTCPHGRRIAMRLTIEELDRIFGRLGWT
jgi:DNA mismatch repair protein MutL